MLWASWAKAIWGNSSQKEWGFGKLLWVLSKKYRRLKALGGREGCSSQELWGSHHISNSHLLVSLRVVQIGLVFA